jgi:hypothetical protein
MFSRKSGTAERREKMVASLRKAHAEGPRLQLRKMRHLLRDA